MFLLLLLLMMMTHFPSVTNGEYLFKKSKLRDRKSSLVRWKLPMQHHPHHYLDYDDPLHSGMRTLSNCTRVANKSVGMNCLFPQNDIPVRIFSSSSSPRPPLVFLLPPEHTLWNSNHLQSRLSCLSVVVIVLSARTDQNFIDKFPTFLLTAAFCFVNAFFCVLLFLLPPRSLSSQRR